MLYVYNINCQEAVDVWEMSARHAKRHKSVVMVVVVVVFVVVVVYYTLFASCLSCVVYHERTQGESLC